MDPTTISGSVCVLVIVIIVAYTMFYKAPVSVSQVHSEMSIQNGATTRSSSSLSSSDSKMANTSGPNGWYIDENMQNNATVPVVDHPYHGIGVDSHNCAIYPGFGWCNELQKCTNSSTCHAARHEARHAERYYERHYYWLNDY